jgi:hypothetical protein
MAKRIKEVYGTNEIAHLWANVTGKNAIAKARNPQGNYHFSGELIYSYREPIARRIARKGKDPIFLHRDCSFSVTTARHQSGARRADYGTAVVIGVKDIGAATATRKPDHKVNLANFAKQVEAATLAFGRCRPVNKEWKLGELNRVVANANLYCALFHFKPRFVSVDAETARQAVAAAKIKLAAENKATAARRAEREAAQAAAHAAHLAELAANLPKWLAGENVELGYQHIREATGRQTDYMRVVGEEIETNRGARVPLHHVKRAIRFVVEILDAGTVWDAPAEKRTTVGQFTINRIDGAIGTVHVGCHIFDAAEVRRLAAILP